MNHGAKLFNSLKTNLIRIREEDPNAVEYGSDPDEID